MSNTEMATATEYWGYLVKPDKSPSPVFEQLLLGIANYIVPDNVPYSMVQDVRDETVNLTVLLL